MKVVKVYLFAFLRGKLVVEELDCHESSKCYVSLRRRFFKDDVGKVIGKGCNECFLLENDPVKACDVFMDFKLSKREVIEKIKSELLRNKELPRNNYVIS